MPLDIKLFRAEQGGDPELVRESQRRRFAPVEVVDEIIQLDKEWRQCQFALDECRKEIGKLSKSVGQKMKAKAFEEANEIKAQVLAKKEDMAKVQNTMKEKLEARDSKLGSVGNLVPDSVPYFKDEEKNEVVTLHGEETRIPNALHHHELLYMIDGYAPGPGVAVAGHRGYFLKGVGVLLNQALISYGLNFLVARGYMPLQPPYFMKREIMAETAQLSDFDESLYKVTGETPEDDAFLIATSEQPISAFHRHEFIEPTSLPISYGGVSTCFRKEAGSHGRDAWGIFRIHQFEKIEQFVITAPEESWEAHEKMRIVSEDFNKSLGLSFRVVNIVSGDLNDAAAKKYDLEAWFPTLECYRELVSTSNCTDYQSRAMEVRYGQPKMSDKTKQYVHMLNGTLCATERTICCLLENYQTPTGVVVPPVLRPYMGGLEFMPFVKPKPVNVGAHKAAKGKAKNDANKQQQKQKQPKQQKQQKQQQQANKVEAKEAPAAPQQQTKKQNKKQSKKEVPPAAAPAAESAAQQPKSNKKRSNKKQPAAPAVETPAAAPAAVETPAAAPAAVETPAAAAPVAEDDDVPAAVSAEVSKKKKRSRRKKKNNPAAAAAATPAADAAPAKSNPPALEAEPTPSSEAKQTKSKRNKNKRK